MDRDAAAAVRYDATLPAPFVVATGRGEAARRLVRLAQEYGVPVQNAPELADRLVELEYGSLIPEELFVPVAHVLAFVLGLDEDSGRKK